MTSFVDWMDAKEAAEREKRIRFAAPNAIPVAGETQYARAALGYEVSALIETPEGGRNHRLNQAAFCLGQLVGGGQISELIVVSALEGVARTIGLADHEIEATIRSGLRAGAADPRSADGLREASGGPSATWERAPVPEATEWSPVQENGHDGPPEATTGAATSRQASQQTSQEPVPVDSWGSIDLGPYLDGSYTPPVPTLMMRSDGYCLLYPGLVHTLFAESESGKTWIMLDETRKVLEAGGRVLYLDFEDNAGGIVGRLLALGTPTETIKAGFDYRRPDDPPAAGGASDGWNSIVTSKFDLVVIDGTTEALSVFGRSIKDNDEIAWFYMKVPRRIAEATGAAVVMIDHVVKSEDGRGRGPIGAQHKMAAMNGAAYSVDVVSPLGDGLRGELILRVAKDRPGQVRGHCGKFRASDKTQEAARFILDATTGDGRVFAHLETYKSEQELQDAKEDDDRRLMEEISRFIEQTPGVNSTVIKNAVPGGKGGDGKTRVTALLHTLAEGGWVAVTTPRGTNSRLHRSLKPYRQTEDPGSFSHPVTEWVSEPEEEAS